MSSRKPRLFQQANVRHHETLRRHMEAAAQRRANEEATLLLERERARAEYGSALAQVMKTLDTITAQQEDKQNDR